MSTDDARGEEVGPVGLPQIDMMATFVVPTGRDNRHLTGIGFAKSLDHFIADLECRTSNRGAYRRINVTRVAAIDTMHRLDRLAGDVPHRTPPTGMDRRHDPFIGGMK